MNPLDTTTTSTFELSLSYAGRVGKLEALFAHTFTPAKDGSCARCGMPKDDDIHDDKFLCLAGRILNASEGGDL